MNIEQVRALYIRLHVDSGFSGCCVAQHSQFCYYRISVTRIGCDVIDEKLNAVCITQNSAYALLAISQFQRPVRRNRARSYNNNNNNNNKICGVKHNIYYAMIYGAISERNYRPIARLTVRGIRTGITLGSM